MIQLDDVHLRAGSFRLNGINLSVPEGTCSVLMGRTGSGKTTLLEAVCGLRQITSGTITVGNRDVTGERPAQRGIGYVPQDLALFPKMTVFQHLAMPLQLRRTERGAIDRRVRLLSSMLGIKSLLGRKPSGLSGGEQQRVALGRAISFEPAVLCLDEPFSALDEHTRDEIYGVMDRVRAETRVTVLHVTHSTSEATRLADDILQLRDGACHQQPNGVKTDATAG